MLKNFSGQPLWPGCKIADKDIFSNQELSFFAGAIVMGLLSELSLAYTSSKIRADAVKVCPQTSTH